jgi:hypothetical protein
MNIWQWICLAHLGVGFVWSFGSDIKKASPGGAAATFAIFAVLVFIYAKAGLFSAH